MKYLYLLHQEEHLTGMSIGAKSARGFEGESYLFNESLVHRGSLEPLTAQFYVGDILSRHSDILLISSFKGSYHPTPGTVLGAIQKRFGLRFAGQVPDGTVTVGQHLHKFPDSPCAAFNDLWVLDMVDIGDDRSFGISELKLRLDWLSGRIFNMVGNGARTISMPLLGTGSQGLPVDEVAYETLKLIKKWAANAPQLRSVRIFVYRLENIEALSRKIDDFLQLPHLNAGSELLEAAKGEFDRKVGDIKIPSLLGELKQLQAIYSTTLSSNTIAHQSRRVAEEALKPLLELYQVSVKADLDFRKKLDDLRKKISQEDGWVVSYFLLLQNWGNMGAHATDVPVDFTAADVAALLIAALRVSEAASATLGRSLQPEV